MRHRVTQILLTMAGLVVLSGITLLGLSVVERDDRFCVACHLHDDKYDRFLATPQRDLTAAHHQKDVRCIDCHGGADAGMRLRVWTIAAVDTGKFLLGRYEEPKRMELPLRIKECSRCHTPILKNAPVLSAEQDEAQEGRAGNAYHAIRPHDTVKITCVRCHTSHTADSTKPLQFIARTTVEPICRECHKTLGE